MDEYITRKAVLDLQHKLYHSPLSNVIELSPTYIISPDAVQRIPAADVVARDCYDRLLAENDRLRKERPVRHGRWIVSRTDYSWNGAEFPTHCKCDQCGREIPYLDRDAYCPTCGARMDKDGDGE